MKIVIVEVEQSEYREVSTITLRGGDFNFESDCVEYGVTEYILETLEDQEVFGWIDGLNIFNKPVKRTYMLVE